MFIAILIVTALCSCSTMGVLTALCSCSTMGVLTTFCSVSTKAKQKKCSHSAELFLYLLCSFSTWVLNAPCKSQMGLIRASAGA